MRELIRVQVTKLQQRIKLSDPLELSLVFILQKGQKPEDLEVLEAVSPFQKEFLRFSEVLILTEEEVQLKFEKNVPVSSFEIKVSTGRLNGPKTKWLTKIFRRKNLVKCQECKLYFGENEIHECFKNLAQDQKPPLFI